MCEQSQDGVNVVDRLLNYGDQVNTKREQMAEALISGEATFAPVINKNANRLAASRYMAQSSLQQNASQILPGSFAESEI
jgi:hypothetical protein